MRGINRFLLDNHIRICDNPCISPISASTGGAAREGAGRLDHRAAELAFRDGGRTGILLEGRNDRRLCVESSNRASVERA